MSWTYGNLSNILLDCLCTFDELGVQQQRATRKQLKTTKLCFVAPYKQTSTPTKPSHGMLSKQSSLASQLMLTSDLAKPT